MIQILAPAERISVMPAHAGIQVFPGRWSVTCLAWIPVFTGMTIARVDFKANLLGRCLQSEISAADSLVVQQLFAAARHDDAAVFQYVCALRKFERCGDILFDQKDRQAFL